MIFDSFNTGLAFAFLALIMFGLSLSFGKKNFELAGRITLAASLISLTVYIIGRWQDAGRPPFSNLYESMVLFGWCVIAIYSGARISSKSVWNIMGSVAALITVIILGVASLMDDSIRPLMPALQSNWLTIHVFSCFVSYSAFTLSFFSSIFYVAVYARDRNGKSLDILDRTTYQAISFGFPFLTFGVISGAIWANQAWGTYWGWDPKEIWSAITWFVYGAFLHMRLVKGLKNIGAALVSVLGFLCVLFTYFGVSYLLPGLHSYLT